LSEKLDTLTDNNEKLQMKLDKEQPSKINNKSTSSNNSTNTEAKKSNESGASKDSQEQDERNIKGSESGIYLTPSSTYYDRTTNVVQWFCSVEEAENAGYRAPKR